MTLLTLAQVREHVETDLVDDALQRLIDAEDEEILKRLDLKAILLLLMTMIKIV